MKRMIAVFTGTMLVMALSGFTQAFGEFVPLPFGQSFYPGQVTANYDGTVLAGSWGGAFVYTKESGQTIIDDGTHGYVSYWDISGDGSTVSLSFSNDNGEEQAGYYTATEGFVKIPLADNGEACGAVSSAFGLKLRRHQGHRPAVVRRLHRPCLPLDEERRDRRPGQQRPQQPRHGHFR